MEEPNGVYEIRPRKLPNALIDFKKAASIFQVLELGLSTQKGIIVTSWTQEIEAFLNWYIQKHNWDKILIRTDKRHESGKYMRGGYLVNQEEIIGEIVRILELERIVLVLEPANRYNNLYGINIRILQAPDPVTLEIVGPGFDVSDLNRGDISPHETIKLGVFNEQVTNKILERAIVDDSTYKHSISLRLEKLGKDLVVRNMININGELNTEAYVQIASQYLNNNNHNLLLLNPSYQKLPMNLMRKITCFIKDLSWELPFSISTREFVISTSILGSVDKPRFIFWDIVDPSQKYHIN